MATLAAIFPPRPPEQIGAVVRAAEEAGLAQLPMTLLREYTIALSALLGGQRVTTHGQYVRLAGVALDFRRWSRPHCWSAASGRVPSRWPGNSPTV